MLPVTKPNTLSIDKVTCKPVTGGQCTHSTPHKPMRLRRPTGENGFEGWCVQHAVVQNLLRLQATPQMRTTLEVIALDATLEGRQWKPNLHHGARLVSYQQFRWMRCLQRYFSPPNLPVSKPGRTA